MSSVTVDKAQEKVCFPVHIIKCSIIMHFIAYFNFVTPLELLLSLYPSIFPSFNAFPTPCYLTADFGQPNNKPTNNK